MTYPVALARAILGCSVTGLIGALVLWFAFDAAEVDSVIHDVGSGSRANILWWGGWATVACVGATLGTIAGGMSLSRGLFVAPLKAASVVVAALAVLGLVEWVAVSQADSLLTEVATPWILGHGIGLLAGVGYVLQRGEPTRDLYRTPSVGRSSMSWGSRR